MPTETNPYAAPRADVNAGDGSLSAGQGTFWRSGQILMTRHGAVLPARCVKCNADVQESLKRARFYWHPPAWFALVLLNVFIYLVVAMIVRRHADVNLGLCTDHRQRRRRGILVGMSGILLSVVLVIVGIASSQTALCVFALLAFSASIVLCIVKGRTLLPVRIDKSGAQFKGCGEAFLASLPSS
jgi:hypothetical protein